MKAKTISALGEDATVARLVTGLPEREDVLVGPGDDCAVVGGREDALWTLLKTDCVVEGIHFTHDDAPEEVGWKALARALSDIAAMGGWPEHALVTIALPADLTLAWLDGIQTGLKKAATAFGVAIVGGETSRSPGPLFLSIALTGRVPAAECLLRSGGSAGDPLYVTGELGGTRAGHHLSFHPRVAEGRWLAKRHFPSCMMDVSDGLGSDLPRLAGASQCGFRIDRQLLPCRAGCDADAALTDGEDYELLFAVPAGQCARLEEEWRADFPEVRLTRIGQLDDKTQPLPHGFDHFA